MINKAIKKRFNLLCPDGARSEFFWLALRVRHVAPYREFGRLPIVSDKDARKAMYAHAEDLITNYAQARVLKCGHRQRCSYCVKCAEKMVDDAQNYIYAWLDRKGITREQWREKVNNSTRRRE